MNKVVRIGTRDSELAVWQAKLVQQHLQKNNIASELIFIKSEGDIDTITPIYKLGVQGVFTRSLDAALLNNRIDIAVHSMKDVPVQLAQGIQRAAVLKRASYKDILVFRSEKSGVKSQEENSSLIIHDSQFTVATSSIRRKAQWLHRYPNHTIENLRGNVNTRLRKVNESNWNGAIFAAAGLERINLRPENAIDLDWMLPAPAQGAIMVVCKEDDKESFEACALFNDEETALCTNIERDFLETLYGGCSTPIGALATIENDQLYFKGNIFSTDGKDKLEVEKKVSIQQAENTGIIAAKELLQKGAEKIIDQIKNASS